MSTATENFEFQAEVHQLLDLMVNSIYSEKEVFLRELISNASDALDKAQVEKLTGNTGVDEKPGLILLTVDKDARTLTISDNGIGMTQEEVKDWLGTIAKSGTKAFNEAQKNGEEAQASDLIGQFGVGFYSAFMVAGSIEVITRKVGSEHAVKFTSEGKGRYTIEQAERDSHGTDIILHLKDVDQENGIDDYTDESTLQMLVKKYSDFVRYPIEFNKSEEENTQLNSQKAIWSRPEDEVTDEEYNEFFKMLSHSFEDPAKRIRFSAEGTLEYQALMFIPKRVGYEVMQANSKPGLQLYVRGVLIENKCEQLLPEYLRFVSGVVDAKDLSLNISREMLQNDRRLAQMQKSLTRKVLDGIAELKDEDRELFETVWTTMGKVVKEGLYFDAKQRDRILKVSMFRSAKNPDKWISLEEYLANKAEGQEKIYYLTGESLEVVGDSPYLEAYLEKGFDVLLMTDAVDPMWVPMVNEYEGLSFANIAEEKLEDLAVDEAVKEDWKPFTDWMNEILGDSVTEVRLSERLKSAPCIITDAAGQMGEQLRRMAMMMGQDSGPASLVLEINHHHELLTRLRAQYDVRTEEQRAELKGMVFAIRDIGMMAEGMTMPDPAESSRRMADLLASKLD